MTDLDRGLDALRVALPENAKRERLKSKVSSLLIENAFTDALQQRRACRIVQSGVIRPRQQFRCHQHLEAKFQTRQSANPPEGAMHPMFLQARCILYLKKSSQDLA